MRVEQSDSGLSIGATFHRGLTMQNISPSEMRRILSTQCSQSAIGCFGKSAFSLGEAILRTCILAGLLVASLNVPIGAYAEDAQLAPVVHEDKQVIPSAGLLWPAPESTTHAAPFAQPTELKRLGENGIDRPKALAEPSAATTSAQTAASIPWLWFLNQGGDHNEPSPDDRALRGKLAPALYCCLLFAAGAALWSKWPKQRESQAKAANQALRVTKTLRLGRATLYLVRADESSFLVGADSLGLKQIVRVGEDWSDEHRLNGVHNAESKPDAAEFEKALGAWGEDV